MPNHAAAEARTLLDAGVPLSVLRDLLLEQYGDSFAVRLQLEESADDRELDPATQEAAWLDRLGSLEQNIGRGWLGMSVAGVMVCSDPAERPWIHQLELDDALLQALVTAIRFDDDMIHDPFEHEPYLAAMDAALTRWASAPMATERHNPVMHDTMAWALAGIRSVPLRALHESHPSFIGHVTRGGTRGRDAADPEGWTHLEIPAT